jgi:hypothetical protein
MRHWILGTGPSIKQTPIHLLKNEITWGINRPPMKPTNYFCIDVNEQDVEWKKPIKANLDCDKVYLSRDFKNDFCGWNIEWVERCNRPKERHHSYPADHIDKRATSWHLPRLCTAFGSMYPVLQLAVLNGATEIYLVGCDLFTGQNDHYDSNYPHYADWRVRNETEKYLHQVSAMSSPVPIYNATIGGKLEIYPRVEFERILK